MTEPPVESRAKTDLERDDESRDPMFAPEVVEPAVSLLAELASAGPVLEFGIGTGRIALPLAARGVEVHGIDSSAAAVARLRSKPRGDRVPVTVGDFSARAVESARPGSFALVYLVFNTIMNVTTQAGQVAVFRNAAAHLRPGGVFVIETMIPDLQRLPVGERFVPFDVSPDHLGFDEYDVVGQGSSRITGRDAGTSGRRRRGRSATSGRPSSTSWPSWPGSGCATAGRHSGGIR